MRAYRPLPSGISVEDEGEMLYAEAGCKSEGYPGCQHSLTMESKKEEFSFGQNLELRFHVKIIHKNLVAQSFSCFWCPSKVP